MTRFEREIAGEYGEFWTKNAQKQVDRVKNEFNTGELTVSADGVLYNYIGRVAMSDICEVAKYVGIDFDMEATTIARTKEVQRSMRQYRESRKQHEQSDEERFEMEAAFGKGSTIVDVITGQTFKL